METRWTPSQLQRIKEMGGTVDVDRSFSSDQEREIEFTSYVTRLQNDNRNRLRAMCEDPTRLQIAALENELAKALVEVGFMEVRTPTIISKEALRKMGIDRSHPLLEQVFWLDDKRCLRPMLAPNLYFMMRHMGRNVKMPLRIFEIGPCYRKESKGANHLEEFTMLNLVEMAPEGDPIESLKAHISTIMKVVDVGYELTLCDSEVYSKTIDVEVDHIEMGSGAVGPHPLDKAHGINEAWAGVGFGLERLLMMKNKETNVKKVGRSLIYQNGVRIDI
jgi:pyrrolysyl-tRNA synthetase-like protein